MTNASIAHLIHRASQRADAIAKDHPMSKVSPRQGEILRALTDDERQASGCTQTEIVEMTGIDRSTLSNMLLRMTEQGLIKRKTSKDDKRAQLVTLTAKGQRFADEVRRTHRASEAQILAAVPTKLREPFIQALRAIITPDTAAPHLGHAGLALAAE